MVGPNTSSAPRTRTCSGDRAALDAADAPTPVSVPAFVSARRSIRAFAPRPVHRARLDALVEAACLAPAPHHSRPWRWVVVDTREAKHDLADGMGQRWRHDLAADGLATERIDELVDASHARLTAAPALLLGCLTWDGLDRYPDEARARAEWGMALLSLGAGVENLMLAATDDGLASCWVAAPIFCPEAAGAALALPSQWLPHALVLVGEPHAEYEPRERPDPDLDGLRTFR